MSNQHRVPGTLGPGARIGNESGRDEDVVTAA
jgi:hypothetical protein